MTLESEKKWLKAAALFIIAMAFVVWVIPFYPFNVVMQFFGDLLFWPLDGSQQLGDDITNLLAVIGGGLMIGFGWGIYRLADQGLDIAPDFARKTMKQMIWIWFITDSVGSVLVGAPLNVIGNSVFLGLVLYPLSQSNTAATA